VNTDSLPAPVAANACSDVFLKVAVNRAEREGAFRLVYQSYLRAGLCEENHCGMRITPYQLLESTDIINAQLRGEVISTVSVVRDGELGIPMEQIYPEEVARRREAGLRLAEVSCLADRRSSEFRFFELFCELGRVMAQLAFRTGIDELLVSVHPRHAPLYRRYMAFEQIGDRRDYPLVCDHPAVALRLNFAEAEVQRPKPWREFFGEPLPAEVLVRSPISAEDGAYFRSIIQREDVSEPWDLQSSGGHPAGKAIYESTLA
jgi:hypothetical protein